MTQHGQIVTSVLLVHVQSHRLASHPTREIDGVVVWCPIEEYKITQTLKINETPGNSQDKWLDEV